MKNQFLPLTAIVFLAACSSPKYTYEFGKHDYNAGKKKESVMEESTSATITASTSETNTPTANTIAVPAVVSVDKETIRKTMKDLSKDDKKALKKNIKKEVKSYIQAVKKKDIKSITANKAMDRQLKMAAIFGAVGLVLTFLGGVNSVFWVLGVIAIVIGVVFFIMWLSRQ